MSNAFDARLRRIEKAIAVAAPMGPLIVRIHDDPERRCAGPDEAEVGGALYRRGEGEDRDAFEARLVVAAMGAGQRMVFIDMAASEGLDAYSDGVEDSWATVEISGSLR
jgi:hypothetical protein